MARDRAGGSGAAPDPLPDAPLRRVVWSHATRIVASRYPPVHLYERVSPHPAVWDALIAVDALVNPRLRDAVGAIHLVAPAERVSGPGASFVMAAFTHLNPRGSRFSDGRYGVYYAAQDRATAIAETAFHFARFAADASDGPRYEDFRVLESRIDDRFPDLTRLEADLAARVFDPGSYAWSQPVGRRFRDAGAHGLHYPSVRRAGGRALAIFRPKSAGLPKVVTHLQYDWDGSAVRRYFDYGTNRWHPMPFGHADPTASRH
ncbi:MAG: RES family NAD+ phosphorylase [Vicinamibacterales bacterium]